MVPDIDWGAAWVEAQKLRRPADDAGYWDGRAADFARASATSPYARTFLERARLEPGETVFDMGCGTGALACPLARAGHEVWACDFSENMLDITMSRAREDGVGHLVHPVLVSWEGDWDAAGIPVCDVAFASRSIATSDLRASLGKLASRARRRVCVTLGTDESPRSDEVLLRAMGRARRVCPDFVFGMNILWQMGLYPELSYIRSPRSNDFASFDEAIGRTCEIARATPEERARLAAYSRDHLHEALDGEGRPVWRYDHVRMTSWAFISWDKRG